jgi:hypothetical protein
MWIKQTSRIGISLMAVLFSVSAFAQWGPAAEIGLHMYRYGSERLDRPGRCRCA